jgi:hypothetical protein
MPARHRSAHITDHACVLYSIRSKISDFSDFIDDYADELEILRVVDDEASRPDNEIQSSRIPTVGAN